MEENKGKVIVFEGLDYSFKETNSKKLFKHIQDNITTKVKRLAFPNYIAKSSIFVKRYLNGRYGDLNEVDPYVASLLYSLDRYDTIYMRKIHELINEGYYIIFDRYIGSNLYFQGSKIKDKEKKKEYLNNILDLEFNKMKLPKPDITIFMNMPVDISFELMKIRDSVDMHESNYKFMKSVEEEIHYLWKKFKWKKIDCNINNYIKSEVDLFNEVLLLLKNNKILQ